MGWSGGTDVFDQVASDLLEADYNWRNIQKDLDDSIVITPLKNLHKVLSHDLDWDNEGESRYWDHPVIGLILGNTFESDEQE